MWVLLIVIIYLIIGFVIMNNECKKDSQLVVDVVDYFAGLCFWPLMILGMLLEMLFKKYNDGGSL